MTCIVYNKWKVKMIKVSVIIPVYNVEQYLRQCLDSVVNQSLKDIEIICIDDGSTDNSGKILDEYAEHDSRIKVIHKENEGYGKSMNRGIAMACGEYIGIVEPDDYIDLNMYEDLYNISQVRNAEIVKSNFYMFDECWSGKVNKFITPVINSLYKNTEVPEFITNGHPCIWSAIYKKDFIKKYDIKFSETPGAAFQDVGFNIKNWLHATKIAITDNAYYHYRKDNNSSSINKGNKMAFVTLNEYKLLYDYINKHDFNDELINCVDEKFLQAIEYNYNRRLNKGHFKFIYKTHQLFNKHKNSSITGNRFYFMVKRLPLLYYIQTLIFTRKVINPFKIKFYIFRLPLFTITENQLFKHVKIIFFKIHFRKKTENDSDVYKTQNSRYANFFNLFQDNQIRNYIDKQFDAIGELSLIKNSPTYLHVDCYHNYLNLLLNQKDFVYDDTPKAFENIDNRYLVWEIRPVAVTTKILIHALNLNKKVIFAGDSFLRSINTHADANALPKYQKGISFTFDDLTSYFDATRPSRLEQMLNDKNLVITEEQKQRARRCIDKIIETHLTKYNHQPIYTPHFGKEGRKKILVVDQSFGDMSILKGMANETTFKNMLNAAIAENPDSDIIIKTHPDTIAGEGRKGYYTGVKEHDNIYTMTNPINPISLIKACDKVYVCSTQLGFEALMCGKETRVFGMPFYAGWGITKDEQTCERRTNTRTLEEIFYIAYILYSYYVNPLTGKRIEIEDAMEYLLNLREEYFKEFNIENDLIKKNG